MADVVLRFVDSIATTRQVRMNLADWTIWRPQDDSRFDPPPPRRALASTQLADGAVQSAATYEDRTIELHWWLQTASTNLAADQIQDLMIELDRPRNILEYQPPNAANPVFFRTKRLAEDLQVNYPTDGTLHDVRATIIAEPFGYGLLETPISGATLNRDPAAASNPTYVDVTGVKGDVETPSLIKLPAGVAGRTTLVAVRRRGTPGNAPWLFQAEAMTQGTDTATQVNDANFSGASNNYSRVTPGTTSMVTRLSITDIGTAGVDLRGRYHVWIRYRKNTSGDGWSVRAQWGTSGGIVTSNAAFVTPATTNICMADLGELQVPRGYDPVYDGRSGVELPVSDTFFLAIQAQRVSGSGTIDFDFVRLMPADDRTGSATFVEASSDHWWVDAEDNSARGENSSNQLETVAYPTVTASWPMLSPNQTNRLHILYEVASGLATALTTQTVSVNYYPRYLSIRPVST